MISAATLPSVAATGSKAALLGIALLLLTACAAPPPTTVCTAVAYTTGFGFYPFYPPVSYSADQDPDSAGFNTHLGYEADLMNAVEAMTGGRLTFSRHPIPEWDGIWLKSATDPKYSVVGGGMSILDSRTRDASGNTVVAFTSGHLAYRQSLLVRAVDAQRLAGYDDLESYGARVRDGVRIGALAGSTGESRLLQLIGVADADGVLAAGTRVDTPRGTLTADGSADYFITAATESPNLAGRRDLRSPSRNMAVVYPSEQGGEKELFVELLAGRIHALSGGDIGNRDFARDSGGALVVSALDDNVEYGGFTVAAENTRLHTYLDGMINWLTDNRRIGYAQWLEDPQIFMRRAEAQGRGWHIREFGCGWTP